MSPSRAIAVALGFVLAVGLLAACSPEPASESPESDPAAESPASPVGATSRSKPKGTLPEVRYYMLDKSCPYCRDIVGVIEGAKASKADDAEPLRRTYSGRVDFVVKPAFDENYDPDPDMEVYGFGMSAHGTVGLLPSGEIAFTLPGHHYGRAELAKAIDAMLAK